jgi:hypothetical protein
MYIPQIIWTLHFNQYGLAWQDVCNNMVPVSWKIVFMWVLQHFVIPKNVMPKYVKINKVLKLLINICCICWFKKI